MRSVWAVRQILQRSAKELVEISKPKERRLALDRNGLLQTYPGFAADALPFMALAGQRLLTKHHRSLPRD